jgi:hypothetical protein
VDTSWDEYKRGGRVFWWAVLLTPLWAILGAVIRVYLIADGMTARSADLLTCGLALVPVGIAHLSRMLWRCPSCGRPFHVG